MPTTAETIAAAIGDLSRRTIDKARDLKLGARAGPAERIASLEQQLGALLAGVPAALLASVLERLGAAGEAVGSLPLEPFHPQLLSGHDSLCKHLLQLPAQRLGKLTAQQAKALAESRLRLKRQARAGREQLEQRLQRHAATVQKATEQRRNAVRQAHAEQRQAELQAKRRARTIWFGLLGAIVATMAVVAAVL